MDDLKGRAISGLFWNLLERVGLRIIQFLPTVILARLLTPEQFGLIGMLSLFIALAQTFLDSGFGAALIQKKDAAFIDECSIFYFNVFIGALSVIILYFIAPPIAAFYGQPLLTGLLRWLSLDIIIQSFALIQTTLLTRDLDFKTQIKANLFATLSAGILGVVAAYLGLGVWSLVIQTISNTTLRTLALWRMHPWRPALVFSLEALKSMFGFGSRLLSSSLVNTFFDNLTQAFVGKMFSAAALGYFTRASSLRSIVVDTTSNTLSRVMFPALASIQDDPGRLKRAFRKSIQVTTFVHFPVMAALIVIARPLIILLFSQQWTESILLFQLMCAAGLLYPLHLINLDILRVKGRSDIFFRLTIIKRSLLIINIIITFRWGISAILTGQIAISLVAYVLNSLFSARLIDYSMRDQILDILPALALSGATALGMYLAGSVIHTPIHILRLSYQILIATLIYLPVNLVIKSEPLMELVALRKKLPLFKSNG